MRALRFANGCGRSRGSALELPAGFPMDLAIRAASEVAVSRASGRRSPGNPAKPADLLESFSRVVTRSPPGTTRLTREQQYLVEREGEGPLREVRWAGVDLAGAWDTKYLLTGFARCTLCNGGLLVAAARTDSGARSSTPEPRTTTKGRRVARTSTSGRWTRSTEKFSPPSPAMYARQALRQLLPAPIRFTPFIDEQGFGAIRFRGRWGLEAVFGGVVPKMASPTGTVQGCNAKLFGTAP